jgi:hypothetical protein
MDIHDNSSHGGHDLTGNYYLENGEQGIITGIRDGSTFKVDFIKKPNEMEKWSLDCNYTVSADKRYIEIKGDATLLRSIKSRWVEIKNSKKVFYATSKID